VTTIIFAISLLINLGFAAWALHLYLEGHLDIILPSQLRRVESRRENPVTAILDHVEEHLEEVTLQRPKWNISGTAAITLGNVTLKFGPNEYYSELLIEGAGMTLSTLQKKRIQSISTQFLSLLARKPGSIKTEVTS
jgi:hypothetical protein